MTVNCISEPLKQHLDGWFIKREKELTELGKLHPSLMGMNKGEGEEFKQIMKDTVDYYESLRMEFGLVPDCGEPLEKLFGTIECIPREIKQDLVPFLKGIAQRLPEPVALEAKRLAETLQNKVAICTDSGRPSNQWLRRRGYSKDDLVTRGNIRQVNE